jgi:hypothetical protein
VDWQCGSTVDRSSASIEAAAAHGRRTARRAQGLTGGAGEGEQGRARPGDGSPRRNPRRRGDATGPETLMAAALRRWRCKRLGGEESEGEGVGNDGERQGPFTVAEEGHAGASKGGLMVWRLNEALKGGLMVGRVTARGRHLEVLSGGRRWWDAVAARSSSGAAGGW